MSPTFAVAFGGGGARGLAHIHAIEALDELGIKPVAIAGSSIGAIMGAGMAAGMRGAEIHEYSRLILGSRAEVAARMWRSRPGTIAEAMQGAIRVGQFNIERILKAFLPDAIPATFEELKIPLKVTATDYFGHKLAVFSQGDLQSALAASAAIPAVFRPVMRDDRLLIDGGIYNPVPFDLVEKDADIIIAIDVVGAPSDVERKHPTTVDLMYGATQLMMQSIIANKLRQHPPDILIRPAVSKYRVLDFLKIETLMADTVEIKDELKRAVEKAAAERDGKLGKAV
ncbi:MULTISPECIES: patatin-like phospholipase family protein [unclassified Mesorhizobium]|uniref:patatin-like phospholipase family protein n=1 Tax=unclassified Mesorhizobium TaxID=325217 RepID=UPI000FCCC1AA|nr:MULTISPECIES: patatin-like phospholipase family protein [unclassified Mesorhizobium]RUV99044.1 patatin-like phospholipase family protein [Mesorhizobium sp. M1A.F.Ca.IN.020.04.1.1]RUW05863.1 patatin-like phospholipase family protein [Mesorhizobium sp. M1A.F.Ca.IN.020.03.1.1]RWF69191.1 MAG: patatin-like phospholipase family protein [Mesorhizobium sp.]RWG14248.1 MAG: patatin-like phospholipase family protein [Mesorhizobium sp.]RWG31229.1 MAG: patatin-like phospholipase family protein [Mesorhiz